MVSFYKYAITIFHITAPLYFSHTIICMDDKKIVPPQITVMRYLPIEKTSKQFLPKRIVKTEKPLDRFDVCYTFALTEQLGITGQAPQKLKISDSSDLLTECNILEKYYVQIPEPAPQCLAVYINNHRLITHLGIVKHIPTNQKPEDCRVISKWGVIPEIFEHSLFDTPINYGNYVLFYTLKNEFQQKKERALELIQSDIALSDSIKKAVNYNTVLLFKLSKGIPITLKHRPFCEQSTLLSKVWLLLKTSMGVDINSLEGQTHRTPLMYAAQRNDYRMVDLLIRLGATIDLQDNDGNTALLFAAQKNHLQATHTLLCYGADENIINKNGQKVSVAQSMKDHIALCKNILLYIVTDGPWIAQSNDYTINSTHKRIAYLLEHYGYININAQLPKSLSTALMIATVKNDLPMVQLLLAHGADCTIQDVNGFTALDFAKMLQHNEIVEYIEKQIGQYIL